MFGNGGFLHETVHGVDEVNILYFLHDADSTAAVCEAEGLEAWDALPQYQALFRIPLTLPLVGYQLWVQGCHYATHHLRHHHAYWVYTDLITLKTECGVVNKKKKKINKLL